MPQSSNFGQRHTYTDKLIYTLSTRIWRIGPRLLLMRMWIYSRRNVKPQQPYQHKCINQGMMDLKCNIVLSFVVYPNLQNYLPNITPFVLKSFIFSRIYNLSNIDNLVERKWYNLLSARINEQTSRYVLKRILSREPAFGTNRCVVFCSKPVWTLYSCNCNDMVSLNNQQTTWNWTLLQITSLWPKALVVAIVLYSILF